MPILREENFEEFWSIENSLLGHHIYNLEKAALGSMQISGEKCTIM